LDELDAAVAAFAKLYPTGEIARLLTERIARFRAIAIGATAPDLAGPTPDGATLKLSSLRGRTVLVDFWASWCGPCRVENRHYVELYRRYRHAGFEILAVSVDQNGPAWKAAIAKDAATWRHISDLTGWKTPLAAAYNVAALPASFLIDPTGKIIAKDLRGLRLTKQLEQIFSPAATEP
jgi:peroxiredoxin